MTRRELCERLLNIHNRLLHEYAMADGMEDIDVEEIGKDIGSLILDIATPEDHFVGVGKMVREAAKNKEAARPTKTEKRALLEKMLILLEDAHSLECEPAYNPVTRSWPISRAIRDEILNIATDDGVEGEE